MSETNVTEIRSLNGYPLADTKAREDIATLSEEIDELGHSDSDTYFESVEIAGKNLLNPATVEAGKYIDPSNGVVYDNTSYGLTDYIRVDVGKSYTLQYIVGDNVNSCWIGNMRFIAAFDADKNIMPDAAHNQAGDGTIYTVPDGVVYIRVATMPLVAANVGANKCMIIASTVRSPFEEYSSQGKYVLKAENNNDAHINGLIDARSGKAVNAYLPEHVYCAVGRTIELYNNQVCLQAGKYHMQWGCEIGKALKRKFSVTGVDTQVGEHYLSLSIYDDSMNVVWEGACTLHIVPDGLASQYTICPIGDSLSNNKQWMPEMVNLSDGKLSFVGSFAWTMKDADGGTHTGGHEGRSGFSARNYIDGSPYTFGGATETEHNAFWDGSRFNWAAYKSSKGINPSVVQIFLGTNGLSADNTANAGYIKQIVDYIRQDDASIPIIVVNTIYRGNQDGIGVQQSNDGYASQNGVWKYNEDMKIMNLMSTLDDLLKGYSGVTMVNLAVSHDSEYNFGAVETPVNPRASQKEYMPVESIHPQPQGYYQMADVLYSACCAVLN